MGNLAHRIANEVGLRIFAAFSTLTEFFCWIHMFTSMAFDISLQIDLNFTGLLQTLLHPV